MILPTRCDLPIRSPLPQQPHRANSGKAKIEDLSADWSLVQVCGPQAAAGVAGEFPFPPLEIGQAAEIQDTIAARLTENEFALLAAGPHILDIEAQGGRLTVTDLTHGRGLMRLSGPLAAGVLAKVCSLDFGERSFPDRQARQTGLAKVHALIVRLDRQTPTYYLSVGRSLAAYVWGALADAMQEFAGAIQ